MPLFSIIVPVHNRAHLIRGCIDSVLGQKLGDFELIIVDNNSTDNLDAVVGSYEDRRIHYTHCATPGPSAARNHGVAASKGEWLSFMDSDDVWKDDVLEAVAEGFRSEPDLKAVYLSPVFFQSDEAIDWEKGFHDRRTLAANFLEALTIGIQGASALAGVRRDFMEGPSGFCQELWVGEDVDWTFRHASEGPVLLLRDRPRLGYRRHESNLTKDCERYSKWAKQLLQFAISGRYETDGNPPLRHYLVSHLMGQLNSILRLGGLAAFFFLYPRIVVLGLKWGVYRPLLMMDFWSCYLGARFRRLRASLTRSSR
jgi:glycosyltransferase involved in cell wall biosynthesis